MKKATIFLLGFFFISIAHTETVSGQIFESDGLRMPGDWNGFTNTNGMGGDFDLTKISTGTIRWQTTFEFTGTTGTQNFKFASGGSGTPWANQWAQVTSISLNTITSVPWTTDGGVGNNSIDVTNGNWYTVNWEDNGYATTDFIFMETSAEPITISSVSFTASKSDSITVSITLSGSKSSEERIYVRYSSDSFSTSSHVQATGSGTSYSAVVPASTDISFYVLNSTVDLGSDYSTYSGDYDMATINFNNNSGSNYSYSYAYSVQITGDAGWRLLSLPITGATGADISDDEIGAQFTSDTDSATIYTYDDTGAFEAISSDATTLTDGFGLAVYFFDNTTTGSELPITLDASGAEPSSDVSVNLNKSTTNGGMNHYFTLVGNPFAANFDLNEVTQNGTGLQDNIHFWNGSSYSSQDRTGPYIVSPWQGFWAEVANAGTSTSITFPTSGKTSSDTTGTFFSKTSEQRGDISFTLTSDDSYDEAIRMAFREYATEGFDRADASKLVPLLKSYATMAFKSETGLKSVESLPWDLTEEVTVDLELQQVGVDGGFTFDWKGLETIPEEWELTFHDYQEEVNVDMREETEYVFDSDAPNSKEVNSLSILSGPQAVTQKSKSEDGIRFAITITPNTTSVSNETGDDPIAFELEQNYPNPFNPSTTINYTVASTGTVTLNVYNLMGQKVAELVNATKAAGSYNVSWDASGAASGMYIYRLEAGGQTLTRKMTLIK